MSDNIYQKYPASVQHGKPRLKPLKEGWNRLSIRDLVEEVSRPVVMEDDELYTLVTAKRSRGGIVEREKLKGRDIAVKNQFYIQEGDFLISKRQIVHGACGFVPKQLDGAIVSNEYLVLKLTDKIIPEFWSFLSHTILFQQICFHSSIGVHIEKMLFKVEQWYQWKINIPRLEEQEKIASFLGAVDTRLNQLRRKREHLQTYKRGVMQKLFSQQIRFTQADGSPFPDWEKKKLGSISEKPQYGLGASAIKFDGKHKYIRITDIDENTHCFTPNPLTSPDSGISPDYQLQDNDLVLARTGASVGKSYLYKKEDGEIYFAGYLIRFRITKADAKFVYYLTLTEKYNKWVFINSMRSGQPGINAEEYSNFSFFLPCKKEQKKIVPFLTTIDHKIETLSRKIDQTEQFKKGLLQKLFV
ncbi:restriction endonuclease subunit S [Laspinema olomoucense]|uniref:restriction endonuclease subunit S n=1 Tax=Laspinema olomoucense TaxID=3231600 RepID=UPI0021BA3D10|nr:restriction endonuclease subunit S [Laspinema sp. D3a]MCT7987563.1 restriction endonuclease subunit S [Laspinema sp. D3a]